ncbi:MAG: DUF6298 domain-containing protein [Planctomycetota bacterium]|jgi:hypothetical protein
MGPLKVHAGNPRYFADGDGKPVYLVGAHTWNNLIDRGPSYPPPKFDWTRYLKELVQLKHNFIRMWTYGLFMDKYARRGPVDYAEFLPWARTGPGRAADGRPKFDLTKYDEACFKRLRRRVTEAKRKRIYVSVMLFEGYGQQFCEKPLCWKGHPMNPANNVNGIDGDPKRTGRPTATHTLRIPAVTRIQKAYVRKVIETVGDLDNVLYEITNESGPYSTEWQYHMIRFVKRVEVRRGQRHPVGMTFQHKGSSNDVLFKSPADWISPNPEGGYRDYPPAADGSKVILNDTDHLWGIGGNHRWVWKSFLRGMNPLYMDPYGKTLNWTLKWSVDEDERLLILANLGHTRRFAARMDLAKTTPRSEVASSGYCLADPARTGGRYLVYLPEGGSVTVDLRAARGRLSVEWFDPVTGKSKKCGTVKGGAKRPFTSPFKEDAVLFLRAVR